jgi:GABA(A) receptor-associated protein
MIIFKLLPKTKIYSIGMTQIVSNKLTFQEELSYEKRKNLSLAIIQQYPDRIPIIIEPYKDTDPKMTRKKFLAPDDITMGKFFHEIRRHMESINEITALSYYIKVNKPKNNGLYELYRNGMSYVSKSYDMILVPITELTTILYNKYKDTDGFLYIIYTAESTFG